MPGSPSIDVPGQDVSSTSSSSLNSSFTAQPYEGVAAAVADHHNEMLRAVEVDPSELSSAERVALLDETLAEVRSGISENGLLLVGGEEATLLWEATVDSFVSGVWVATILCAQATCERVIAALVSLRELPGYGIQDPRGWESWGLGRLIKHVRQQGWVSSDLLDDVEVLCEARKPYGHWRRPLDPGTLGRQVADVLRQEGWDVDPDAIRAQIL